MFREADKRYNSGMFSGDNIIFDLNNMSEENKKEFSESKNPDEFQPLKDKSQNPPTII